MKKNKLVTILTCVFIFSLVFAFGIAKTIEKNDTSKSLQIEPLSLEYLGGHLCDVSENGLVKSFSFYPDYSSDSLISISQRFVAPEGKELILKVKVGTLRSILGITESDAEPISEYCNVYINIDGVEFGLSDLNRYGAGYSDYEDGIIAYTFENIGKTYDVSFRMMFYFSGKDKTTGNDLTYDIEVKSQEYEVKPYVLGDLIGLQVDYANDQVDNLQNVTFDIHHALDFKTPNGYTQEELYTQKYYLEINQGEYQINLGINTGITMPSVPKDAMLIQGIMEITTSSGTYSYRTEVFELKTLYSKVTIDEFSNKTTISKDVEYSLSCIANIDLFQENRNVEVNYSISKDGEEIAFFFYSNVQLSNGVIDVGENISIDESKLDTNLLDISLHDVNSFYVAFKEKGEYKVTITIQIEDYSERHTHNLNIVCASDITVDEEPEKVEVSDALYLDESEDIYLVWGGDSFHINAYLSDYYVDEFFPVTFEWYSQDAYILSISKGSQTDHISSVSIYPTSLGTTRLVCKASNSILGTVTKYVTVHVLDISELSISGGVYQEQPGDTTYRVTCYVTDGKEHGIRNLSATWTFTNANNQDVEFDAYNPGEMYVGYPTLEASDVAIGTYKIAAKTSWYGKFATLDLDVISIQLEKLLDGYKLQGTISANTNHSLAFLLNQETEETIFPVIGIYDGDYESLAEDYDTTSLDFNLPSGEYTLSSFYSFKINGILYYGYVEETITVENKENTTPVILTSSVPTNIKAVSSGKDLIIKIKVDNSFITDAFKPTLTYSLNGSSVLVDDVSYLDGEFTIKLLMTQVGGISKVTFTVSSELFQEESMLFTINSVNTEGKAIAINFKDGFNKTGSDVVASFTIDGENDFYNLDYTWSVFDADGNAVAFSLNDDGTITIPACAKGNYMVSLQTESASVSEVKKVADIDMQAFVRKYILLLAIIMVVMIILFLLLRNRLKKIYTIDKKLQRLSKMLEKAKFSNIESVYKPYLLKLRHDLKECIRDVEILDAETLGQYQQVLKLLETALNIERAAYLKEKELPNKKKLEVLRKLNEFYIKRSMENCVELYSAREAYERDSIKNNKTAIRTIDEINQKPNEVDYLEMLNNFYLVGDNIGEDNNENDGTMDNNV